MGNDNKKVKEKFDALFAEWEKAIQAAKIRLSSRPQDYINNKPYCEIVKLGREVLPFIIEKLEQVEGSWNGGGFFLNQAVVEITGSKMEEIIGNDRRFVSEQEKSALIVKWWRLQKQ